jgi:hypothetical protein
MSDSGIIAIVVGVVAIVLFLLLRRRLTRVGVDLRRGRLDAAMDQVEPLSNGGARQRRIDAAGNVTARDETGVGASQDNVKAGGDVNAIVKHAAVGGDPKKS